MGAGSFAKYSGAGQAIPGTSYSTLSISTEDSDTDNIVSESSNVFTPSEAGYYLILATGRFDSTHNNRMNLVWNILQNGSNVAGTAGSGYSRNNANKYAYVRAGAILYFNGTTDTFSIQHKRDTGAGTPAGTYGWTRIKIVNLGDSLPYARYGTPTSGAYGGNTASVISGWDTITETDTSVIELQAGGSNIQLKEAFRPYLIIYSLQNSDSGSARTTRVSDVTMGGSRIVHSGGYAYQRDSSNQNAIPFGMALVNPLGTENINIRCWGYDDDAATLWGTFSNGSWTLSSAAGDAGVMVIALPSDTDFAIFEDPTGGTVINGSATADLPLMDTQIQSGTNFTKDNSTSVTVGTGTDVFAWAGVMVERIASSGTRSTQAIRWEIEGVDQDDSAYGNYLRGEQGSQDTKNMYLGSNFTDTVLSGDTFQIEKFDPGTDDGANDRSTWGGTFFIDLQTLSSAPPILDEISAMRLVDADLDIDIVEITDGAIIDESLVSGKNVTIVAETTGTIGSVVFSLTGTVTRAQTESVAPYVLHGDSGGDYAGVTFPIGSYTIVATAYDGGGGTGSVLDTIDYDFTISSGTVTGQVKYWNGSSWEAVPSKYWNGSSWETKPTKFWNGSSWVETTY